MEEIQFIKSMETLSIKDGDILVVKVDRVLLADVHYNFKAYIEEYLSTETRKLKILILEPGMDLGVVRKEVI